MFNNYNNNLIMVEGAYKKLKSYYYYDKSLLYIKEKIASFESDEKVFNETLNRLAESLKYDKTTYFDSLIQQVGFVVLPKKMRSRQNTSDVIKSTVDHTKNVAKINFFIDAPIELLILDTLWTILLGKIQTDNECRSRNSYALPFKKSLFKKEHNLFEGIDFKSNRCFEPYFKNYVQWRDGAFSAIEKEQNNTDLVLMTLDMQSFYYSVDFDFKNIASFLNHDRRLQQIDVLSNVIEKVYHHYTSLIKKYKKGITNNETCIFPIGLMSPLVLRDAYMKSFDDMVVSVLKPHYYARYVDDILLVLSAPDAEDFSRVDYIEHFLIANHLVSPSGKNSYKLKLHPTIKLQSQKIECFFFKKGTPNTLLNIYKEQIQENSSEANLLPDVDVINASFDEQAYTLFSESGSTKIRDLRILQSNNYSATRLVNSLKRILKNSVIDYIAISPLLDRVLEFYCDSQGIEFLNNWRSVFELFTLCHDKERANKLYCNIKNYIERLTFELLEEDEIYAKNSKKLLRTMKRDLQHSLDIAISLAIALDYGMGKKKKLKDEAVKFRISNLLNHQLISIPLINYVSVISNNNQSLIDINQVLKNIRQKEWNQTFKLDRTKLKWGPRFIHIEELYFSLFIFEFSSTRKKHINYHSLLYKRFCTINELGDWANLPVKGQEFKTGDPQFPSLVELTITRKVTPNSRVAVVSIPLSENDALQAIKDPYKCLTLKNKSRLFKILNTAQKEHARYISFPEFYLPIAWLPEVWSFSKENNMTVVTGLQYLTRCNQAYNFTCVIEPLRNSQYFYSALLCFKEKLYYAPEEQKLLARSGFITKDSKFPYYYVFVEPGFTFSTILCFEFTDIYSRAVLKGKIDALFVPQLNRDTNYFSSIVSATSRDLHCFIIQTNTSIYGDSRITGPFKTEMKNILQIKGGTNDVVILGEINVDRLRERQRNCAKEILDDVKACLNCTKKSKISNIPCKTCVHNKRSDIKGTPPNFVRKI